MQESSGGFGTSRALTAQKSWNACRVFWRVRACAVTTNVVKSSSLGMRELRNPKP